MMRVGSIGSVGRLSGRQRAWTNAALFAAGQQGALLDPSDISTLFQDVAGTIPVTAPGQAVALVRDKSGRGNHASQATPGSRPLYALNPSSGIRNVLNGSADVGNTAVWFASATSNGVSFTKTASGFDAAGLPYVELSVSGTAAANLTLSAVTGSASRIAAATGNQFTTSFIGRIVSGTCPAGCGLRADAIGENSSQVITEAVTSTPSSVSTDTTLSATIALSNAATVTARAGCSIFVLAGQTVNFVARVTAVQFERGSTRTAYQWNYGAANIVEPPFAQLASLLFDGNDDFLQTPAIDFSATDEVTVIAGIRKQSDAATGMVVELSANYGATNGGFALLAPSANGANSYRFAAKTSTLDSGAGAGVFAAAPNTSVITGVIDLSGDTAALRRNGVVQDTSFADWGTGNFANAPLYIGRRGGSSLPFNGRIYGLTVLGAITDAATLARAESWQNQRTGAY